MCLGGRRSSRPALQERTTPEVKQAPADESTAPARQFGIAEFDVHHPGTAGKAARTWDDVDAASPSRAQDVSRQISDSGINY